jgi:hypothetical protein
MLAPLYGIVIFVGLYVIAAFFYPGGSQVDKNAKGFSWTNNYWCNLLSEYAINGTANPARPVALTAMCILCVALSFFWYLFPRYCFSNQVNRFVIQFSGMLSMAIATFLFTSLHDSVINIAGALGVVAIAGILFGLYKNRDRVLFWFGIFNLVLIILNNYVYYTNGMIIYLPVIQKFSFLSFLAWICCLDIRLYNIYKS